MANFTNKLNIFNIHYLIQQKKIKENIHLTVAPIEYHVNVL